MNELQEISKIVNKIKSSSDVYNFMLEILTKSEVITLSKRWRILKLLYNGETQRNIAKELNVSLCNVTRGAKILKDENSVITKYLIKENKNAKNN